MVVAVVAVVVAVVVASAIFILRLCYVTPVIERRELLGCKSHMLLNTKPNFASPRQRRMNTGVRVELRIIGAAEFSQVA